MHTELKFVCFWSCSGVNMYAMLTGTLPFTVEPFSLRALHQKMVDKEMNPLPPSLSTGKHITHKKRHLCTDKSWMTRSLLCGEQKNEAAII